MVLTNDEINSRILEFRRTCSGLIVLNVLFDEEFRNIPDFIVDPVQNFDKNGMLFSYLIDNAIILLVRLFKIQPKIGQVLMEETDYGSELLNSLSFLWTLISKDKNKLEGIWRNKIIAHSEKQLENYVPYHMLDSSYPSTMKNILTSMRLTSQYYVAIEHNAKWLFDNATSYEKVKFGTSEELPLKQYWKDAEKLERDVIKKTNIELTKNGFEKLHPPRFDYV